MFVIKENLRYGEDYLCHTAAERESDCYKILTGESITGDCMLLNSLLEERYGVVFRADVILPVYEIVRIMSGVWHCGKCGIRVSQAGGTLADYSNFTVTNGDGDKMGTLFKQNINDIVTATKLLDDGGCPVCDGWDDGHGNICSPNGWGRPEFFFRNYKHISRLK
ncbi:MAG: hypothetical protein CVU97_06860 [Firmicutes bacterium HGW-Firmicutes-21]|nr:MAG: hypothetical protein CVU97_06860 [Firmicutes bacterium HGW-Firmicutes-21]